MKNATLLELAYQWEMQAKTPEKQDGKIPNAKAEGAREAKRECADAIRMLCSVLGDR